VAHVLADPDRFVDATLADPLEGLDYGRCKAQIMRRRDGTLWVHSFAHGRTTYELRHDAASVEAALRATDPKEIADRLLLVSSAGNYSGDNVYLFASYPKVLTQALMFDYKFVGYNPSAVEGTLEELGVLVSETISSPTTKNRA
jgi:hypothetical protein